MTDDLKRQVREHVSNAAALVSDQTDAEGQRWQKMLRDVEQMVTADEWQREANTEGYTETITYKLPANK